MTEIIIINGVGTSGKDTFCDLMDQELQKRYDEDGCAVKYSSVKGIKEIAKMIGWNEQVKTEKDRKFLSDLKMLCTEYNDYPFNQMKDKVKQFNEYGIYDKNSKYILFLHIREPKEIERAAKEFNAKTLLIRRNSAKQILTNDADANVENYNYDYIIENNGTLDDLRHEAENLLDILIQEGGTANVDDKNVSAEGCT